MSPTTFYALTYKEAKLILEGYKQEQEDDYYHNYYAVYNAIGAFLGGKKFAPVEVFENSKKEDKKKTINQMQTRLAVQGKMPIVKMRQVKRTQLVIQIMRQSAR